jgi:bifunctional non-homologous end joining protein LigD
VIVDGEIIAIPSGRPDLGLLQSRIDVRRPRGRLVRDVPVQLYLFDVLQCGGELLLRLPCPARRERLEQLGLQRGPVRTLPWYPGGAADVQAARLVHGLEGVVGKPLASARHPGQRRDWIKIKNIRHAEVIIGGWSPGQGRRDGTIGSLLPGVPDHDGQLRYAGHVGTGFTQAMLADLEHQLCPLRRDTSPFTSPVPAPHARGGHWSGRGWPARSPSPKGPPARSCATPAGAGYVPTKTPATCARTAELPRIGNPRAGLAHDRGRGRAIAAHAEPLSAGRR